MGRRTDGAGAGRRRRPATSPDDREQQLAGMAYDLAEQQLLDGTASAAVMTQLMRFGSTREVLERQRLEHDAQLAQAKIAAMESASKMEALYEDAIRAMSMYQGHEPPPGYEDDEY